MLRMIRVVFAAMMGARIDPLGESVISLRVWLNDLDTNLHMNNGRYLTIMDLGRLDFIVRTGLGRLMVKRRWRPMVGSAVLRFRRGLAPFERYELKTRVAWWDDKWFWIEQRFEREGEVVAVGAIKGLFRAPTGNVPTADVLSPLGVTGPPGKIPEWIAAWRDAEPLSITTTPADSSRVA